MKLRLVKQGDFLGIKCDFYEDKIGEVYMTRKQIGEALQYADPQKAIDNIHDRNKSRLDQFSVPLKLRATDGKDYLTDLYKTKGIYEVIRFSRQPIANDFYDWVYDVIDAIRTGRISQEVLRKAGIGIRHTLTDSIRDNVEDSPNKKFVYKHFTDLVYKVTLGFSAKELRMQRGLGKEDELRDYLTVEELKLVQKKEEQVRTLLELGMGYHEVKEVFGRTSSSRALPRKRQRKAVEEAN
ncbi:BRO family protein [Paenibacillus lautus]|uniref:BRO family protein n=1 Tax=Paenibacillus lautus TaxID=1401 RepID=UPI003D2B6CD1